jgi:5,10-methylenetetrahydromethanopterin reductase
VHLARIAERTQRIGIDLAVLIPSYRHPVAQASAIATLEHIAPGRVMVAFGTGFRATNRKVQIHQGQGCRSGRSADAAS